LCRNARLKISDHERAGLTLSKVSRPAGHKTDHFGGVLPSQSLESSTEENKPNTTKANIHLELKNRGLGPSMGYVGLGRTTTNFMGLGFRHKVKVDILFSFVTYLSLNGF